MMYLQCKSPGRLFRYLIIVDTAKPMKVKFCFNDVSTTGGNLPVDCFDILLLYICYCRYSKAEDG